jgi:hypothetical protein
MSADPHRDLKSTIETLEEALWRPETRFDRTWMDRTLAPDFFEFGRSGRIYDRDGVISSPEEPIAATFPLESFAIHFVTADVLLATYVSRVIHNGEEVVGNRSSLWSRCDGQWRLRFHQGTPA